MSWLPRLQIALFAIVIVGMPFLIFGHWESGWSSLAYFAWGNGYFRRRSSAESHCLQSNSPLSAKAEKGFNRDRCRLNGHAPRSCASVANGLINRWSQPRAVPCTLTRFDRVKMVAALI
jgi:hypothetical protein